MQSPVWLGREDEPGAQFLVKFLIADVETIEEAEVFLRVFLRNQLMWPCSACGEANYLDRDKCWDCEEPAPEVSVS